MRTIRGLSAKRNARAAVGTLGAHFRLPCRIRAALICIILIVRADAALAHSQDGEAGLQAGFMHPLTGPDHLLAMVAVGMVSVVLGGAAIWRVPAAFLAAMLVGAMAGYAGWRVAHVEIGVAASVLLLGIALTLPSLVRWRHVPWRADRGSGHLVCRRHVGDAVSSCPARNDTDVSRTR